MYTRIQSLSFVRWVFRFVDFMLYIVWIYDFSYDFLSSIKKK